MLRQSRHDAKFRVADIAIDYFDAMTRQSLQTSGLKSTTTILSFRLTSSLDLLDDEAGDPEKAQQGDVFRGRRQLVRWRRS